MIISTEIISLFLICISFLILVLDSVGQNNGNVQNYSHTTFLTYTTILAGLTISIFNFYQNFMGKTDDYFYAQKLLTIFLFINSLIFLNILRTAKEDIQLNRVYFFIIASIALILIDLSYKNKIVSIFAQTTWLISMASMAATCTKDEKTAEIALKLSYSAIFVFVFSFLSLVILESNFSLANIFAFFFSTLAIFCFAGIPPFHVGHLAFADGINSSMSFFLYSNSFLIGAVNLLELKKIFFVNDILFDQKQNTLEGALFFALIVLSLRSLDQSKIKRTICYLASCIGPIVALVILFGSYKPFSFHAHLFAVFTFTTLSLFTLFGSFAFMKPINSHLNSWEDISGFGREDKLNSICLILGIFTIAGIPGTFGYFIKISLLDNIKNSLFFSLLLFLSTAMCFACALRIFVFLYSKSFLQEKHKMRYKTYSTLLIISSLLLAIFGIFIPLK